MTGAGSGPYDDLAAALGYAVVLVTLFAILGTIVGVIAFVGLPHLFPAYDPQMSVTSATLLGVGVGIVYCVWAIGSAVIDVWRST